MNGLNENDFSARWLDNAIPGFTTPDPLAERHPYESPYLYCGNNPVNRVDPTGKEWYYNSDSEEPVWINGDKDVDGYDEHGTDCYAYGGADHNELIHYTSPDSDDSSNDDNAQNNENQANINMYANSGQDDNNNVAPDRSCVQSYQSRGAEVVSSFPVSDPNSNFGLGNSYNLYTPNQTKAAEKIILAIGTAGLAAETGVAAALGEVSMIGLKKIGVISLAQFAGGFVEGTLKSIFGPDPEMGSSMFLNPASDVGLNVSVGIWNAATILDKNPLPSYP